MAITVEVANDPPITDVLVSGLPVGTTKVLLLRTTSDREARVRGDDQANVIGSDMTLRDYDVPIGRDFTYRAHCYASDGTDLGWVGPSTAVQVPSVNPWQAWLSDPLVPALARKVTLNAGSDSERTYDSETVFAQVAGAQRPVAISGTRSAADGWTFRFRSTTFDEATAINSLIAGGGVLLLRANASVVWHETGLIYLSSPTIKAAPRRDLAYQHQRLDWELSAREVQPPSISAVAPLRTWQDVLDQFATWQDVKDYYDSWLNALRGA